MSSNLNITSPQGVWQVSDQIFTNKYQALLYATEINSTVNYVYFDDVWSKFDRSLLGQYTLQELYKKRAEQLRRKYDYLILYFSGGSDSYNILRTFIDNGIKLDEVCVKWCTPVLDRSRQIYTPNTEDITAENYISEWDFAINPVLEELKVSNPEIKINIVNWLDDRFVNDPYQFFDFVNHWQDIEIPSLMTWSPSETELTKQGKTVGGIYGVDKPYVYFGEKEVFTWFTDAGMAMAPACPDNPTGVEVFYWSPEFPVLTFEMAYQTMLAQNSDEELAKFKYNKTNSASNLIWTDTYQYQQKKLRYKLYNNWTDRFQTQKPIKFDRTDKHSWMFRTPGMKEYTDLYFKIKNERIAKLNPNFTRTDRFGNTMFKALFTRTFTISKISR